MGYFSTLLQVMKPGWFLCPCPSGVHHRRDSSSDGLLCKKKTAAQRAAVSALALFLSLSMQYCINKYLTHSSTPARVHSHTHTTVQSPSTALLLIFHLPDVYVCSSKLNFKTLRIVQHFTETEILFTPGHFMLLVYQDEDYLVYPDQDYLRKV